MCTFGSSLKDGVAHDVAHTGWNRRQFLRGLAVAGGGVALGLNGVPVFARSEAGLLAALGGGGDPDRVLVLIQLAGGNDGLNTIIPVTNDLYYQARPTLGIPAVNTIPLTTDLAFHSSLSGWEAPYDDGLLAIIQNVGYERPELSHFVSTDVWLSADDASDQSGTGWLGRYLDQVHPDFDLNPPDYPIAVQIGSASPLLFQAASRSLGVNFPSPALLSRLAQGDGVYDESGVPDTLLGQELAFVRRVSNNSFSYAQVLKSSYDSGRNRWNYPGSSLGQNLATIARLIRGGLGSRIYHVTLGGFDTHANQAGGHATLLRRLGDATAAFMNDLAVDGLDDRVLAMTFSEFGRRIRQNSSAGTDHGTAAPLFVMGSHATGGLIGHNPDLANLDPNGNLVAQVDFRSVYASVLAGWFGMPVETVGGLLGGRFAPVPLFQAATSAESDDPTLPSSIRIGSVYPNPTHGQVTLNVGLARPGSYRVSLVDVLGREVGVLLEGAGSQGEQTLQVELPGRLAAGNYLLRVSTGNAAATTPLTVR